MCEKVKFCPICCREVPIESFYYGSVYDRQEREFCHSCVCHGRSIRRNYGLTIEEYAEMLVNQKGRCSICGRHQNELKQRLFVDHSHKTGKVRSLLCCKCNNALGYIETNNMTDFMVYIDKHDKNHGAF